MLEKHMLIDGWMMKKYMMKKYKHLCWKDVDFKQKSR